MVVMISLKNAFATSPGIKTSGPMRITPYFTLFPGVVQNSPAADSAAPVIDSAIYYVNSGEPGACDTLKVVFSEPVKIASPADPFLFSGKSTVSYTLTLTPVTITGAVAKFCVASSSAKGAPQNGDTIWIAVNGGVSDTGGVVQKNPNNRKTLLAIIRPKTDWQTFIACNPFSQGSWCKCDAVSMGAYGTVIIIKPVSASSTLPSMALHLQVFDLLGNCVHEDLTAQSGVDGNSYYFIWDGRNKSGRFVGTGIYRGLVTAIDESGTSSKAVTIGVKR
jgi:hypothetical protein